MQFVLVLAYRTRHKLSFFVCQMVWADDQFSLIGGRRTKKRDQSIAVRWQIILDSQQCMHDVTVNKHVLQKSNSRKAKNTTVYGSAKYFPKEKLMT